MPKAEIFQFFMFRKNTLYSINLSVLASLSYENLSLWQKKRRCFMLIQKITEITFLQVTGEKE